VALDSLPARNSSTFWLAAGAFLPTRALDCYTEPSPNQAGPALLNADPVQAVFLGDSPSDIEAAHAAGVRCVGYANKPGKQARLLASQRI
jgi:phosphoglycolate phosphatase-like HAD superfamily hydrolase